MLSTAPYDGQMVTPGPRPLTPSLELLTRVASLYYVGDLTQEEIASQLDVGRAKEIEQPSRDFRWRRGFHAAALINLRGTTARG